MSPKNPGQDYGSRAKLPHQRESGEKSAHNSTSALSWVGGNLPSPDTHRGGTLAGPGPERKLTSGPSSPPSQDFIEIDFAASNEDSADCTITAVKIQIPLESFIAIMNL